MGIALVVCKRCGTGVKLNKEYWVQTLPVCETCWDTWIEYDGTVTYKEFFKRFRKRYPNGRKNCLV